MKRTTGSIQYQALKLTKRFPNFTTDDAKVGTYCSCRRFFVEWDKDTNGWEIIGHELTYISGADQSSVGKFTEFNEPPLEGFLNNAPLSFCIIFQLSDVTTVCG